MIPCLAVDPSLTSTGWAIRTDIGHGITETDVGTITPTIRQGARHIKLQDPQRMLHIAAHIRQRAQRHDTRLVAIEGPSFNSVSSVADRIYGMHWHIRSALWAAQIPYLVVPPSVIKFYATGFGLAPKLTGEVRGTVRLGMLDAAQDSLGYRGKSEDIADALWLHALTADALGQGYVNDPDDPDHREKRRDAIATVVPLLPPTGVL